MHYRPPAALTSIRGLPLWAMTVLVLLSIGAWLAWSSYEDYRVRLDYEYRLLETAARNREARIGGALRGLNLTLDALIHDLIDNPRLSPRQREQLLSFRLRQLPEARNLVVTDASGRIVASNRSQLIGFDATQREYFISHRTNPGDGQYHISHPFNTITGVNSITLSRAIVDHQGKFAGVIAATVEPTLFDSILNFSTPATDGQSLLIHEGGEIVYAIPHPDKFIGKNLLGDAAYTEHLAAAHAMTRHRNPVKITGIERISVFLKIPDTPLIVVVSRDYGSLMAEWKGSQQTDLIGFAVIVSFALFLAWLASRRLGALQRAHSFARQMIETANVMVVGLDKGGRVSLFNATAERISGYAREQVLGQEWFDLLVPRERFPEVWYEFRRLQSSGEQVSAMETPILTRERQIRTISWRNSILNDEEDDIATVFFGIDISERKQTEETLRRMMDESPLPMLIFEGKDDRVTFTNRRFEQVLGYTRADIPDILHWWPLAYPDPDIRQARMAAWPAHVAKLRTGDTPDTPLEPLESQIRSKDGQIRIFSIYLTAIGDRHMIMLVDLTERRTIEARLAETLELNERIIAESPAAVMVYRADGPCIQANDAAVAIIGGAKEQLLRQNYRKLEFWRATGLLDAALDTLAFGKPLHKEIHGTTSFGKPLWLDCKLTRLTWNDKPHLLLVGTDVSEFRLVEQALRQATQIAESANRSKSEFLANMSHEIRTPMNAVIGLSQLALGEAKEPRLRDYLQKIFVSANALLGLLNDILDYSKIEAGRLRIEETEFSVQELIDNAMNLLGVTAAGKGIALETEIAADTPQRLTGDPLRLGQVLTNLIGNAVKFTERGIVRLVVCVLAAPPGKARLSFAITDTGIGMTPDQLRDIFQPFVQADGSTTRRYGGSGLGLAISRRLLQLMGGEIEVESSTGAGSRFSFELELGLPQDSATPPAPPALATPPTTLAAPLAGAHILLVEDNAVNQQVAQAMLQRLGLMVAIAANGEEALALLVRQDFDAVLMDLQMPVMDGFEATRRIRADKRLHGLPIVALTASAMARDRTECLAAGMNDHLSKPINMQQLAEVLLRVIPHATNETGDLIRQLDGKLRRQELVTREALALLESPLAGTAAAPALARLRQAMEGYNFSAARIALTEVAAALAVTLEEEP